MKTMNNGDIFMKALINGLLGWGLFAVLTMVMDTGIGFGEALIAGPSIYAAFTAFAGSFIGYEIRKKRGEC